MVRKKHEIYTICFEIERGGLLDLGVRLGSTGLRSDLRNRRVCSILA